MNKIEFLYNKDKYKGIDSSEALSHYGILGQKWGQRRWQNQDGTFNEAGKERYFGKSNGKNLAEDVKIGSKESRALKRLVKEGKRLKNRFDNADINEKINMINDIAKDERYKEAFDKIKQLDDEKNKESLERTEEIFEDFKDEETKHLATAGIMNMLNSGYYPNPTMEDLAQCAWFYAYEDGNQGENTAEYLYSTIDKGVPAKEISELYRNLHNHENIKDEAVSILKENPVFSSIDEKYLKRIILKKLDNKYDSPSYWSLYAANGGWGNEPDDKQKKDYAEAKKIAAKLDDSCGNSDGWDYLNKAIENLDLSATELKNMTQSDWDRINAEVNRLKK